ncbi:hypothetical protein Smic_09510 [Streptomyces microflavus]|uniref:Uncharacterized protein n=1 Tax=Streptomyces microflavus TaxID=1919 RepID=A0A7J0CKU8_STRMI|nr:hypothetical protein Smic_09510 [Streptomyces microflavus]
MRPVRGQAEQSGSVRFAASDAGQDGLVEGVGVGDDCGAVVADQAVPHAVGILPAGADRRHVGGRQDVDVQARFGRPA